MSHQHAVQYYAHDADLIEIVGSFLSDGLIAGEPAIVIATPEHQIAIADALQARQVNVGAARRLGDLLMLDVEETLATFMADQMPMGSLFRKSVGEVIAQAQRGRERTPVRVYGEMVDVLWKHDRTDAAVRLEILWNNLSETHVFSLLCG